MENNNQSNVPFTNERVIRNVSLEEIEKLKQKNAVQATVAYEETNQEENKYNNDQFINNINESSNINIASIQATTKSTKSKNETKIHTHKSLKNNTNNNINIYQGVELKKATSVFEPKPYPIVLPSGNFVVKKNLTPNNEIFIRRMGSLEESMFINLINVKEAIEINNVIDSVIDSCIKTNISVKDLSLIDKFTLFAAIIHLTYGPIDVSLTCPECNTTNKITVNLMEDLVTKYLPKDYEYPKKIHLTTYDEFGFNLDWYVGYFTIGQASVLLKNEFTIDSMLLITDRIEGKYIDENGNVVEPTPDNYLEILKNLNERDCEAYRNYMRDIGSYGTNFVLKNYHCNTKGCIANIEKRPVILPTEQIFMRIIRFNQQLFV